MKKSTFFNVIIVLLIIVLGVFFIGEYSLLGFTTMSVSTASFQEGGEIREGFLFNVVVNGGGESITMRVTPGDIKNTGLAVLPESFTVKAEMINPVCTYRIEETQDKIYRLYQATVRDSLNSVGASRDNRFCSYYGNAKGLESPCPYDKIDLSTVIAQCKGKWGASTRTYWTGSTTHSPEYCGKVFAPMGTDVASPGSSLPQSANCDNLVEIQTVSQGAKYGADVGEWCYSMQAEIMSGFDGNHWRVTHIAGEPFYNVRNIGTRAYLDYEVKFTVENKDGIIETAIVNSRDKVANLGQYGKIKLVGNLMADEFCENPSINYDIVENKGISKFVLRTDVNRYMFSFKNLQNFDNNYYQYINVDPGVGADVLWYLMSSTNGALNDLYNKKVSPMGCEIKQNNVVCSPETQVAYPNIQLLLESTFVGISEDRRGELDDLRAELKPIINIPKDGKPRIMFAELIQDKIYNRQVADLRVAVKNIGTDDDSFDVSLTCGIEEISFASKKISIKAGATQEMFIKINGDTGRYLCKVIARSVNQYDNYDEKAITIVIEERNVIQPPEFFEGLYKETNYLYVIIAVLVITLIVGFFVVKKKRK
jgi:hypothetical protein